MKRVFVRILTAVIIVTALALCTGADEVRNVYVNLDGNPVDCASYGQETVIVEGRTLVPLRAIFESLGANVVWDSTSRTVISCRNGVVISLEIGSNTLVRNDRNVTLDVPAAIMNGRTMVPLRAVAEAFDVAVEWDTASRTAFLTTTDGFDGIDSESFESSLFGKKAYGEFTYGMTMQQCWDAADDNEGKRKVVSLGNGISEIQISDNDSDNGISLLRLVFAGDYLYCTVVGYEGPYTDTETENTLEGQKVDVTKNDDGFTVSYTDRNVENFLYGYDVPSQARLNAYYFLLNLSVFDTGSAAAYCNASNSVKLLNVRDAGDMLSYVGFDRQKKTDEMVENTFGGNENYRPVAKAMAQAIEDVIIKALAMSAVENGDFYGISETKASLDFSIKLPDVRFAIEKGKRDFAVGLETVLSENITEPDALDGRRQLLALAPVIGKSLYDSCIKYFDTCPSLVITPEKPLEIVLEDGNWVVDADGEYVKVILNGFKIFE